ncbi:hypothetical protein [Edaphobacter modestus]|uniref:Uncharacterized protein n=1 Tax=Edaphobacter modestus TaxID=388466 RepID=A0A4Q7XXN6_9BACT|nr:hypothetical protein [Edaphobacter modestus]RZU29070.1 hypothetical protein BDD14_6665 [Edaphobacter modestus]
MDELETAIITKTGHGFEVTDNFGEIIGSFKDWDQIADMFSKRDFSEEYIAKRRADLDRNSTTKIDETNE